MIFCGSCWIGSRKVGWRTAKRMELRGSEKAVTESGRIQQPTQDDGISVASICQMCCYCDVKGPSKTPGGPYKSPQSKI
jgi:hypothetical protein